MSSYHKGYSFSRAIPSHQALPVSSYVSQAEMTPFKPVSAGEHGRVLLENSWQNGGVTLHHSLGRTVLHVKNNVYKEMLLPISPWVSSRWGCGINVSTTFSRQIPRTCITAWGRWPVCHFTLLVSQTERSALPLAKAHREKANHLVTLATCLWPFLLS